jgi:2-phosphosulfolactate phosphatase
MVGRDLQRLNVDCQWGMNGLRAIASGNIVVIVDVLSFSTATTVAVAQGAEILPCEWNDARAVELAKAQNAQLASKRGQGPFSLAPASMKRIARGTRLVLPSPNGSTLAQAAQRLDAAAVVVGCLRNAGAVAAWAMERKGDVSIIAAGERWEDGTIRFAIEDWLGAGAIVSRMVGNRSAEGESAAASFERLRYSVHRILAECPSGRELIEAGYPDDIDIASEVDADHVIPLLQGNAFKLAAL